jgi:predicted Fe-Mo cluster-binding NifX family protein
MSIKIAAVTQDGVKLSSHFGMAPQYRVFTIEDGAISSVETRDKPHHSHHPEGHGPQGHHEHHYHGHEDMFAPIQDCQALLCGGMGTPAYRRAQAAGLEVFMVGGNIENAVEAYLNGGLSSDMRRVHQH